MVILKNNTLEFNFTAVHPDACCSIEFQRTLRIPDDNQTDHTTYSFATFPLLHVEDFAESTPDSWQKSGGVFLPMYQAEALSIKLSGHYPCAIKIATGKINAVTGEFWNDSLSTAPQDYVVVPKQSRLGGFCISEGLARQFVAMPLGEGFTAEEQLTGNADVGGIQLCVYPMKKEVYEELFPPCKDDGPLFSIREPLTDYSMGLAPSGLMWQKIYEDKYGIDVWDTEAMSRCFVHLANSEQYLEITGDVPPIKPPAAKQYTDAGLPWVEYYPADKTALQGAIKLAGLDSVATMMVKLGKKILRVNDPVEPMRIISSGSKNRVSDEK